MMSGLLGKKIGMTNVFASDGQLVPVTVLQVGPCVVTQIKTEETDGYTALQLGFDEKPVDRLNKPIAGHLKKASDKGFRVLKEFREESVEELEPGATIGVDMFSIVISDCDRYFKGSWLPGDHQTAWFFQGT